MGSGSNMATTAAAQAASGCPIRLPSVKPETELHDDVGPTAAAATSLDQCRVRSKPLPSRNGRPLPRDQLVGSRLRVHFARPFLPRRLKRLRLSCTFANTVRCCLYVGPKSDMKRKRSQAPQTGSRTLRLGQVRHEMPLSQPDERLRQHVSITFLKAGALHLTNFVAGAYAGSFSCQKEPWQDRVAI